MEQSDPSNVTHKYLEAALVAEDKIAKFHGNDTFNFLLLLGNMVGRSIVYPLKISVFLSSPQSMMCSFRQSFKTFSFISSSSPVLVPLLLLSNSNSFRWTLYSTTIPLATSKSLTSLLDWSSSAWKRWASGTCQPLKREETLFMPKYYILALFLESGTFLWLPMGHTPGLERKINGVSLFDEKLLVCASLRI